MSIFPKSIISSEIVNNLHKIEIFYKAHRSDLGELRGIIRSSKNVNKELDIHDVKRILSGRHTPSLIEIDQISNKMLSYESFIRSIQNGRAINGLNEYLNSQMDNTDRGEVTTKYILSNFKMNELSMAGSFSDLSDSIQDLRLYLSPLIGMNDVRSRSVSYVIKLLRTYRSLTSLGDNRLILLRSITDLKLRLIDRQLKNVGQCLVNLDYIDEDLRPLELFALTSGLNIPLFIDINNEVMIMMMDNLVK
jgi:hypothetical protein